MSNIRHINDAKRKWYANQGQAESLSLIDQQYNHMRVLNDVSQTTLDNMNDFLISLGYTGSLSDMWLKYLQDKLGRVDNISDLELEYYNSNAILSLQDANGDGFAQVVPLEYQSGDRTYTGPGGTVYVAGSTEARIQYSVGLAENALYCERAGTNLCFYSAAMTSWNEFGISTGTISTKLSPFYTGSQYMMSLTNTSDYAGYVGLTVPVGTTLGKWVFSCWIAGTGEADHVQLELFSAGLQSTVGTYTVGTTPTRCEVYGSFPTGGSEMSIRVHCGIPGGTLLDVVYCWGGQLENPLLRNIATSYIPTAGTMVSRGADDFEIKDNATMQKLLNPKRGTICLEFSPKYSSGNTGTIMSMFAISGASGTDLRHIYYDDDTGYLNFWANTSAGTNIRALDPVALVAGSSYRFIGMWDAESPVDYAGSTPVYISMYLSTAGSGYMQTSARVNGDFAFDASADYAHASSCYIGHDQGNDRASFSEIANLRFFDRALSLEEAIDLWKV